jgi:hypothetical protein
MTFCLGSELIKADIIFESFVDLQDEKQYKKLYQQHIKQLEEVTTFEKMTGLPGDELTVTIPDFKRIKES